MISSVWRRKIIPFKTVSCKIVLEKENTSIPVLKATIQSIE